MAKDREPISLEPVEYRFGKEGKSKGGYSIMRVVLTGTFCHCTKCGALKPMADFGLRLEQGVIRNQAQCKSCRS